MLFCRVCFHYGLSYRELMNLPIKTFWMLNKNIGRLLAEQDLRAMRITAVSQDAQAAKEHAEGLLEEFDNPYKTDGSELMHEERDEAGFAELKLMAG